MTDRFDELMHDISRRYNVPPEPPLDAMWARVEEAHFGAGARREPRSWRRGAPWLLSAIGIAASLLVGIGIGRYVVPVGAPGGAGERPIAAGDPAAALTPNEPGVLGGDPYRAATSQYLGQTAALLIALPSEMRAGREDRQFVAQAGDLLMTTRLLLDSPAASDPELRHLLDDLELILAQIARLPSRRPSAELDLIAEALEQRDVMPRLRSAAAGVRRTDS